MASIVLILFGKHNETIITTRFLNIDQLSVSNEWTAAEGEGQEQTKMCPSSANPHGLDVNTYLLH